MTKRPSPLSQPQRRMLLALGNGDGPKDHCCGMAEHGGAEGTLTSLVRRGLVEYDDDGHAILTNRGIEVLATITGTG